MADDAIPCTQEGCNAASGGACVDGLSLEDCPRWKARDLVRLGPSKPDAEASDLVRLRVSDALSAENARLITLRAPTTLVVLAGQPASGKTTLLATVFDLLSWGKLSAASFAGSSTLAGFERRCFEARTASEREVAQTRRTDVDDEARFLHLNLRLPSSMERRDFLFTDVSGEHFDEVRDNTKASPLLPLIARSDHFTLALDGDALVVARTRHSVISRAALLARALVEANALPRVSGIQVVLTKVDVAPVPADVVEELRTKIAAALGPSAALLSLHVTAARQSACTPWGSGFDELVKHWWVRRVTTPASFVPPESGRAFDRFRARSAG